jgi:pimeloyl-ACP methyl ester carboxylesterase
VNPDQDPTPAYHRPHPPRWFADAVAAPTEVGAVRLEDADVRYRAWGEPGERGVVLIHGGAAHARWWDHIGPLLSGERRVVAIDLSGHGDSDHRPAYRLEGWAEESMAVAEAAGIEGPPVLVGHSMGGYVALTAAVRWGSAIEGIITIDSRFRDNTPEQQAARRGAFSRRRVRPSRAEAVAHWRPVPDQEMLPYVADHVAEHSVAEVPGGWGWKFDPSVFARADRLFPATLHQLDCRAAVFRAEYGLLSATMIDVMYDRLGRSAPTVEFPAAFHAVMLDQPLALVTAIRTLLSDWEHSVALVDGRVTP